jgi:hypothetical protein
MFRRLQILGACATFGLFLTPAAQAGQIRVDQEAAGSCVTSATGENDCIAEARGAPANASYRKRGQAGPYGLATERCAGFDLEASLLEGEAVATSADLSQAYAVLTSGFNCYSFAGTGKTVAEYVVVGGSGRFEGASGSLLIKTEFVALRPSPGTAAIRSTVEGELTVP